MQSRSASVLALAAVLTLGAGAAFAKTDAGPTHPAVHRVSANRGDAVVDQLNAMSLQRARSNQNSPTSAQDTTGNLNTMSQRDANHGVNVGSQPLVPFR